MDTALVVMAAGIGSRYGQGIKQLEKVGPNGEIIIDYSIHDAIEAGFNKVVFIIRKDIEKDFKEIIGDRISKIIPVEYAYQDINDLPDGRKAPEGRTKPWGTGQAILCCKDIVKEPFCAINADDYYGKEGFKAVHDFLVRDICNCSWCKTNTPYQMCMAGFILRNTLSENGGVTRGICTLNLSHNLSAVTETFGIEMLPDGSMKASDENGNPVNVTPDQYASMNLWGLPANFFEKLEKGFSEFLDKKGNELKSEYLLPSVIDECIKEGSGTVKVLPTDDKWFGVTYHEDKEMVVRSIRALVDKGVYTSPLF